MPCFKLLFRSGYSAQLHFHLVLDLHLLRIYKVKLIGAESRFFSLNDVPY